VIRLSRVVLPAPLGPSTAQFSPRLTVQSNPSKTVTSPNATRTPFISRRTSGAVSPRPAGQAGRGGGVPSSAVSRAHSARIRSRGPWRTARPSRTHRTRPMPGGISSTRWVTRTSWTPPAMRSSNSLVSSSREAASMPPKGSSRTTSRGLFIRARAMSTLRSSPAERPRIGRCWRDPSPSRPISRPYRRLPPLHAGSPERMVSRAVSGAPPRP